MKKKLSVPNDLSEISLGQYQKFHKIQEKNDDPYFLQCKMIEIFCNLDALAVRKMKMSDAERVANIINGMFEKKPPLIRSFNLDDKEYSFIPDLNNISFGEYIDLDTNISDWQNMHLAMNVLYRPVKQKLGEKYLIEDYDLEGKDKMFNMPMSVVMSSIFFFFHLGMDLSKAMMNYLETNQEEVLMDYLSSQRNGDGISQFTVSLKEMLQDLKISLN
tara:strand:- start:585 stop:1235 length:651 start_codon:yes stop_codon:yes gene_type:complete